MGIRKPNIHSIYPHQTQVQDLPSQARNRTQQDAIPSSHRTDKATSVLLSAANLITARGMCRRVLETEDGRLCALGSILRVVFPDLDSPALERMERTVADARRGITNPASGSLIRAAADAWQIADEYVCRDKYKVDWTATPWWSDGEADSAEEVAHMFREAATMNQHNCNTKI